VYRAGESIIDAIYRPNPHVSVALRSFIDFLVQRLRQDPDRSLPSLLLIEKSGSG
jgi:hypothetical protein